jgi:CheY-like chemotaxis protein
MPKILSISDNDALRVTRHMMLQNRNLDVASAANLRETRNALKSGDFDLVILCVSIDAEQKREMASMARKMCERAKILELCRISPEVPEAEHHLFNPEPADLDQTVDRILKGETVERSF